MGKETRKRRLILMDGSSSKKVGVNFSNKDALFNLWFHLINLYSPRTGVCRNNQSTANKKESKNTSIDRTNKLSISEVDQKKTKHKHNKQTERHRHRQSR